MRNRLLSSFESRVSEHHPSGYLYPMRRKTRLKQATIRNTATDSELVRNPVVRIDEASQATSPGSIPGRRIFLRDAHWLRSESASIRFSLPSLSGEFSYFAFTSRLPITDQNHHDLQPMESEHARTVPRPQANPVQRSRGDPVTRSNHRRYKRRWPVVSMKWCVTPTANPSPLSPRHRAFARD
jgi:hypothetical protein